MNAPALANQIQPERPISDPTKLPEFGQRLTFIDGVESAEKIGRKPSYVWFSEADAQHIAAFQSHNGLKVYVLHTQFGSSLPIFGELLRRLKMIGLPLTRLLVDTTVIRAVYPARKAATSQLGGALAGPKNSVASVLDDQLATWIADKVSDLHIELRVGEPARFRVRKKGMLVNEPSRPYDDALNMVRAIYNSMADQQTTDRTFNARAPQMASIERETGGATVKLRFQSMPAYPGDSVDVTIRLHRDDPHGHSATLSELGYEESHVELLQTMMKLPYGAIIIAGITGSGKTTTLKAMLDEMSKKKPNKKYISVESPPEYLMPAITQVPAKDSEPEVMKAIMAGLVRADPDVIMMGEVRNAGSSEFLTQMIETGHKMLATTHTDSIFGIPQRLHHLGVPRHTMGYSKYFSGLMCQALVPTLCPSCKVPFRDDESLEPREKQALSARIQGAVDYCGFTIPNNDPIESLLYMNGGGCEACGGDGWAGRTVCAEMTIPDQKTQDMIAAGKDNEARARWRADSRGREDSIANPRMDGRPVLDHAIVKMLRGSVSPVDIEDDFGPMDFEAKTSGRRPHSEGAAE